MQTLQVESELEQMVELYCERKPRAVLEIGVWHGGTLKRWLLNADYGATVVAVDLHHPNRRSYEAWKRYDIDFIPVYGDSQNIDVVNTVQAEGPYDWVFIDGDHSHLGVSRDVGNYLPMVAPGGVLLLHDIAAPHDHGDVGVWAMYPPGEVFGNLWERYETSYILSPEPSSVSHGIGVVYV